MKIAIYALCSADGVIQYVGQTNDFEQRKLAHFSASGRFYRSRYKMRVLRWSAPDADASDRIEIQIIRALKKRGQCAFNRQTNRAAGTALRGRGMRIFHKKTGRTLTPKEAAIIVGMGVHTAIKYARNSQYGLCLAKEGD